jgi:hypothetical protein
MAKVFAGRYTAQADDDFVVFLIGMRVNKRWKGEPMVARRIRPAENASDARSASGTGLFGLPIMVRPNDLTGSVLAGFRVPRPLRSGQRAATPLRRRWVLARDQSRQCRCVRGRLWQHADLRTGGRDDPRSRRAKGPYGGSSDRSQPHRRACCRAVLKPMRYGPMTGPWRELEPLTSI